MFLDGIATGFFAGAGASQAKREHKRKKEEEC